MEKRKEFDPFKQLTPIEYQGLLLTVNLNYQDELRRQLSGNLKDLDEVCIILTGSDGKKERHCQSRTEIIIIGDEQSLISKTRYRVSDLFNEIGFPFEEGDPEDNLPEGRILNETLSYAYNNQALIYPDRILHSQLIIGSGEIYHQAILKILDEIITKDRIYKATRQQLKSYKKALREGIYRKLRIFSWETGIQYYDENKDPKLLKLGFKLGPIRAVQRQLDLITFKALRENEQLREKIINQYLQRGLSNTMDRIEFLTEIGLIPKDLKDRLIEAYYWFLQQYHQAQEVYKNTRRPVELSFDPDLANYHRKIIEDFLEIK